MADEQSLIAYTVPPLTYVDPAHILLFGTSGDAGVNVLAEALVARQSDGQFYARGNWAGTTALNVQNNYTGAGVFATLAVATGTPNRYALMQVSDEGGYRQIANGSAVSTAYDDANTHWFRTTAGAAKLALGSDLNATFYGGILRVNNGGLIVQHDGSNGYIRSSNAASGLYLGAAGANVVAVLPGFFGPTADNSVTLGGGSGNRWSVVFSATGSISTSDERAKRFRPGDALTDAELRAARRIGAALRFWQWIEEIDRKGEDQARWHFGASAQAVARILIDEGIEQAQDIDLPADQFVPEEQRPSFRTAFLCFDTWEDQWEDEYEDVVTSQRVLIGEKVSTILGADGEPIREPVFEDQEQKSRVATGDKVLVTPAGNRFGLRVDQLCLFLAAAQEQRLAALEAASGASA